MLKKFAKAANPLLALFVFLHYCSPYLSTNMCIDKPIKLGKCTCYQIHLLQLKTNEKV